MKIREDQFDSSECLATLNRLYPSFASPTTIDKTQYPYYVELKHLTYKTQRRLLRTLISSVENYITERPWKGSDTSLDGCVELEDAMEESTIRWQEVHRRFNKYLDKVMEHFKEMQFYLRPLPRNLQKIGINEEDCVLDKMVKYLHHKQINTDN